GDLGRHRGRARDAQARRAQRPPGQQARRQRLSPAGLRGTRAVRRRARRPPRRLGTAHQESVRENAMTVATKSQSDVADLSLADAGSRRIEWAGREMPVLESIRKRVKAEQ